MRGRAAHQLDEVPVLQRRAGVLEDVADQLAVDARGCVEAKRDRQQVADLQVAVDRFRHADHLHARTVGLDAGEQRFREHGRVGIGIVAANDDDGVEIVPDAGLAHLRELLVALDLGAIRSEEVEAAGVQDEIDVGVGDLEERALEQALGTGLDAEQGIAGAKHTLEAADDIVAAGGRATREEDGDALTLHPGAAGAAGGEDDVARCRDGLRELGAHAVAILGAENTAGVAEADRLRVARRAERGADRKGKLAHGRFENRVVRFCLD